MAVSINEALNLIEENTTCVTSEIIPIEDAYNRVVYQDYIANFNLPRFDNSAMDGYAVKATDSDQYVTITDTIYAGDESTTSLEPSNAIKIMTGAPVPNGCEAIIPIEDVEVIDNQIKLPSNIKDGNFIRRAGEDIKKGTPFLNKGDKVNAYTIASLASQGITHISVYKKINIAIFATGDELRPHYEKIEEHQLYNSNTPMFAARAKELNCNVQIIKTSQDTIESLQNAINSTLNADIIITSGGVSVGDKDFTKEAFLSQGMKMHFSKVDIKPGKPTAFGTIGKTAIINLPGNPLASMVNFELFVKAAIYKMSGLSKYRHNYIETKLQDDFQSKGGKYAVVLGKFDGITFEPIKPQMPGMVSPMQSADGFMLITPDIKELKKDSVVKVLPVSFNSTTNINKDLFTQP